MGNSKKYVDIIVFKDNSKKRHIYNSWNKKKRKERYDRIEQLKSCMSAIQCEFGVWTNGCEIEYLWKDNITGKIKQNYITNILRKGESFDM